MPRQDKNINNANSGLPEFLEGIQSEVGAESAPLLRFITRHAAHIAAIVVLFLLVLGAFAIRNWREASREQELRDELSRINQQYTGKEQADALASLAEKAPDNISVFIFMTLGKNALENGDPKLAADAYTRAASLDAAGAVGLAAKVGQAASLLAQEKFQPAIEILKELDVKQGDGGVPAIRQMLAEAASAAGQTELAVETWERLAQGLPGPEGAYFRSRAEAAKKAQEKK